MTYPSLCAEHIGGHAKDEPAQNFEPRSSLRLLLERTEPSMLADIGVDLLNAVRAALP